jgi:DNA-binding beta-propeller fold protein YncE
MRVLGDDESRTAGPYRLIAELGRGGMGRVLLGAAPDGRLVAVKQIRAALVEEDGFVARFRREVAASRKVSGAYTAAVVDAEVDGATPWLASVFVPGPSLQDTVDVAGVLPEEPALRLAAGLAAALGEIHRAGLVHRDLKPSNVLLAADGVRVIDFGIARAVDGDVTELTRSGWLIGSPGFMSPEQAEGRELTAASDVFSLGAVLVMAGTGQSPFAGPSTPRTLYNVVHAEPDLTALPGRVREIAALCLAKDPADRPSPAELLTAIGPVTPSTTPWPAEVHRLIEKQHAEVATLLSGGTAPETPPEEVVPEGTVDLRTTAGPTHAIPAPAAASPPPARRKLWPVALAALVVVAAVAALVIWWPWSDEPTGQVTTLDGHTGYVNDMAFTRDGVLVTGSADYTVRLWDLARRRQVARWDTGAYVESVAVSPDGTRVAAVSEPAGVLVWDVEKKVLAASFTHEDATDVAFSPDGKLLASSGGSSVRLWNVANPGPNGTPLDESDSVLSIAFSPDGATLAVAAGKSVYRWDLATRTRTDDVVRTAENALDVEFAPDGRTMAVADGTASVLLWDVEDEKRAGVLAAADDSPMTDVAFDGDGTTLASHGIKPGLWDVPGRRELPEVPIRTNTYGLALSPDGGTLVTSGFSGELLLYH